MKDSDGIGLFGVLLILFVVWGVISFISDYWHILLGMAVIVGLLYALLSEDKPKQEQPPREEYVVRRAAPKLPPMPYSSSNEVLPTETFDEDFSFSEASNVPRLIEIFYESLSLVETSENIETVDNRFGDCLKFGAKLAAIASPELEVYRKEISSLSTKERKIHLFDMAAKRYISRQVNEIDNLRTEAGKKNRVEKILRVIDGLKYMPAESKASAKRLLASVTASSTDLVPVKNSVQPLKLLPKEILDLLWFADGALKNYSPKPPPTFRTKYFSIIFPEVEEPSLIRGADFVGVPVSPAPRLDYFPTYAGLSPNERATYLEWLRDVDSAIDIGYVFIFYYGLERWLLVGGEKIFGRAFEMILRLRGRHENSSFQGYSSATLIASCLIRGNHERFDKILRENLSMSPILLACLAQFKAYLNADAVIALASAVGFTNSRYLKNNPELFRRTLNELLRERFSAAGYPLGERHLIESPPRQEIIFANVSLKRECTIPDVARGETFRRDLSRLLSDTHEKVKLALREERKRRKD